MPSGPRIWRSARLCTLCLLYTSTDHAETDGIYQNAERGVVKAVIRTQTTEGVDTVAGATYSSQGILEAVADALRGAVQ